MFWSILSYLPKPVTVLQIVSSSLIYIIEMTEFAEFYYL